MDFKVATREYKGESELEFYNLLSPDDGPELDECEGCGDMFEDDGLKAGLCEDCYYDAFEDLDGDDLEDEDEDE